jgi:hypothetical protein
MNRQQIENLFRRLACSQGMYGRLLNDIYSQPEEVQEQIWSELESQNFQSDLDVVLYVEG